MYGESTVSYCKLQTKSIHTPKFITQPSEDSLTLSGKMEASKITPTVAGQNVKFMVQLQQLQWVNLYINLLKTVITDRSQSDYIFKKKFW
jgi:hypothetical protein